MSAKIIIVDEEDKVIVYKYRDKVDSHDIYRVSALWITNKKGKVLLARRSLGKKLFPDCWGPAVAGTVEEGETYRSNIVKEAREELGLKDIKLARGPKVRTKSADYNYFTQWYFLTLDKEVDTLKLDENEVSEINWFTREKLKRKVKKDPEIFTHAMKKWVEMFC